MFKEILLPVDLQESALSLRATQIAQEFASQYGARITVITVIPSFGMPIVASFFPPNTIKNAANEVLSELKRFVAAHFQNPEDVSVYVAEGSPHEEILEFAARHGNDLIIVPARGKNIEKILLGSSSIQIVEQSKCTVMVVRP